MSRIRTLDRADLPGVSALFERVMGSVEGMTTEQLARYFERIFLDDPWADEEIPPLVYEAPDGEIVGFTGANARRMRLGGTPIRMAVSSNLVAHPEWRDRGVGALLNRALLAGPQDLTVADRANDDSRRLWFGLGGQEMVGSSVGWYRVLRPGATLGGLLDLRGRGGLVREGARLAAGPVDAVSRRLPKVGTALAPVTPEGTTEPMGPEELVDQVRAAGRRLRLHPDYDVEFLRWAFDEVAALRGRGRLVARLVRSTRGQVLGWFLYLLPEGGVAQVLQFVALGADPDPVLDHLFAHAHEQGAAAVHGRLEPALSGVLSAPGVIARKSARALVHASDPAVLGALGSTTALLSHLDGEWLVSHARRQ